MNKKILLLIIAILVFLGSGVFLFIALFGDIEAAQYKLEDIISYPFEKISDSELAYTVVSKIEPLRAPKAVKERCKAGGATPRHFSSGCADSCGLVEFGCTSAFTWGCDCGDNQCWDGESCIVDEAQQYRDSVKEECASYGLKYSSYGACGGEAFSERPGCQCGEIGDGQCWSDNLKKCVRDRRWD